MPLCITFCYLTYTKSIVPELWSTEPGLFGDPGWTARSAKNNRQFSTRRCRA